MELSIMVQVYVCVLVNVGYNESFILKNDRVSNGVLNMETNVWNGTNYMKLAKWRVAK